MSEPTSRGSHALDPDPDQSQDSGFFSDPTAAIWADLTAPVPTPSAHEMPSASIQNSSPVRPAPLAPPGPAYAYGQRPAAPHEPAPTPPQSNPYAQQPPVQQYGQQYGPPPVHQYGQPQVHQYGQPQVQQYGQPQVQQYGQPQAPAYRQPYGTGAPSRTNGSAITLTVLSALSILSCIAFPAIASLVLGIIALTKNSTDPEASRRMSNIGWIVFGVSWGLAAALFILLSL
jgi:hypothetical protein